MTSSTNLINKKEHQFQSLVLLTIILVYLLILAGGIVRATGSGMGCPDWPKCFGRWIPPTEYNQLPSNYQVIYGAKLKGEVTFNALKTWIEYVNRLLGVLTGFFVLGTLLSSFAYWYKNKAVVWGSLVAFVLVGINGWLGSRVVATELAQYLITAHLTLAILVVCALIYARVQSKADEVLRSKVSVVKRSTSVILTVVIILTMGQLLMGTQVRGALDAVITSLGYSSRNSWIDHLGLTFYIHRSFSLVLLVANIVAVYHLRKLKGVVWFNWIPVSLLLFVLLEILTGVVMAYFGVPAFAQPIHLTLAVGIIGLQFTALLLVILINQSIDRKKREILLLEV